MTMALEDNLLESIHRVSLYLLLEFDRVCRENNLTYFLDSGTALGAVRHGGFIPWDDDIDVGMPRKDYEVFLRIGQDLFPKDIFIQTPQTDSTYKRYSAKLRLEGTHFPDSEGAPCKHDGFFIDIFPFDNVPGNPLLARWYVSFSRVVFWIIRTWRSKKQSPSLFYRSFQSIVKRWSEARITRISDYYLRFCTKYQDNKTGKVTSFFWRMTQNKTYVFDVDKLLPTKEIMFEGHSVKIMKSPDYYLTKMYGDYMTLPPEDKRHYHCKGIIDFGKYAED